MATFPISMKRCRVKAFAASFDTAIWTLRLPPATRWAISDGRPYRGFIEVG
jgi:hypothetical protein